MASEIHLIGIGGVGMSALAQAFLDAGFTVTGADRSLGDGSGARSPVLQELERQGVRLFPDDGSGVSSTTARVVISTAVEETNPGLRRARELGVPVTHRAAALAEVLSSKKLVAVAGTCGKSTVTAILGHLLTACGFDPVVVNGAQIVGWDAAGTRVGSTRGGCGEFAVAEVDESDKSLVAFKPYAAVVTNASADHYSKEEMDAVFDAFVENLPGPVIDGRAAPIVPSDLARTIPLPGEHNAVNAECAVRMALALGAESAKIAAALKTFPGVERRLQRVGVCGEAVVYDDYAHNPEKLHAMLTTLQSAYPKGVAVVWRPHGYAPLRKMMDALVTMFRGTLVGRRTDPSIRTRWWRSLPEPPCSSWKILRMRNPFSARGRRRSAHWSRPARAIRGSRFSPAVSQERNEDDEDESRIRACRRAGGVSGDGCLRRGQEG